MFKRIFWLSALLAVSAFAGQVIIKSRIFTREDIAVVGETNWDRLANAASQTTQELWNSARSLVKSASFLLPDAVIQSLSSELPAHDATVGSTPGQGGVSGGSASYSIPIALPPGRKGMQPNISLSYSSKGGNGVAGMGWNISGLSSIHRCPQTLEQDNQIRAVDYSMNDRLCLDGQRLVATSGTYGNVNTTYATEIDSFARITQLGSTIDAGSSVTYFKVEYKSGEIAYFGGTSVAANAARVIAGGLTKPLNWLIARSEDRLGNNIVYNYTNFGNGEVQPSNILYTGFTTTPGDRKVEFIYETRPSTAGANDQSSSYLAGGLTRQTQRLTTVKTWVGAEAVREYRLNYGALSASSGRSLLRSVQECAMLSGVATCRRPISFNWQEATPDFEFKALAVPSYLEATGNGGQRSFIPTADYDGDGLAEIYSSDSNGQYLLTFDADKNLRAALPVTDASIRTMLSQAAYHGETGDFDKDGKSDLIGTDASGNYKIYFWDNPGITSSVEAAFSRIWATGVPAPATTQNKFLDFDADGYTDIITYVPNQSGANSCKIKLKFWKNAGAPAGSQTAPAFTLALEHCLAGASYTDGLGNVYWDYETIMKVTDFNGDNLPDFLLSEAIWSMDTLNGAKKPKRILYGKRDPSFSVTSVNYSALFPGSDQMTTWEGSALLYSQWIDINADGLEDLLYARSGGYWTIRINNGKTLGSRINLQNRNGIEFCDTKGNPCSNGWTSWYAGKIRQFDYDSDGRAELLIPRRFAQRTCAERLEVSPVGDYEWITYCPEDPITGSAGGASLKGMYYQNFGGADNSAYFMSALRIIETGPNQYSMVEVQTDIVDGPDAGGSVSYSNNMDMYGDGLADSLTSVASMYPDPGAAIAIDITTLPNGDPVLSNKIYINENQGAGLNTNNKTPKSHDTLASVVDGLGNTTSWTHYPLSSKANRNAPTDTPLYSLPTDPAQRYIDSRHVYFSSSMQVVSEIKQSDGIGGTNTTRYGYSEAMYNTYGRGFQGFRKIIEEDMTGGLRTTTTFSQRYPLTSRVEKVVVNPLSQPGETNRISQTDNIWRCNRLDRNDTAACNITPGTNPVRFVYQSFTEHVTFDLETALAGLPYKLTGFTADYYADTTACDGGTISTVSGYDAYGNITAKTHFVSDYSDGTPGYKNYIALSCNRTRNTYAAADTTNWWLDKVTNTEVRNEILHGADQPLPSGASNPVYTTNTAYTWNTNRTLAVESFQSGIAYQHKDTYYTYPSSNNYGLPLSVLVSGSGDQNAGGRTTSTTYSTDGYFPLSVTNALGHTATTVVRLRDGLPISVTDPNGLRSLTTYDAFSQAVLVKSRGALDSQYLAPDKQVAATWCTVVNEINSCGLSNAAYQLTSVQDGSPTSISTHDKLGRVLRTQSKLLDGTNSYSDTQYNNKGQTTAQSLPYRNGDTPLWTYFVSYDILGRLTAKTTPQQHATRGDMVTTYAYTGRTTAIQVCGTLDPNTNNCLNLSRTTDATGRYVETTDAIGGVTKFWFDANGQAAVLQDVKGSQIKATYNAIGQRVSVNDPNQGTSNFTYNALGEVLTQTDARAITSTTTYDKLGRKTQFSVTADANGDGTNDAIVDTWTYDPSGAKGQLAQSKRTINGVIERQEDSSFDTLIRPSAVTALQNTGGGTTRTYSSEFQYDAYYGRVLAQFMPNGEGEQFIFNQYGYETEQRNAVNASVYRQIVTVDSAGRPTRELKGFNLSTDTAYWPNGQTKSIVHQKDGVTIRKIDYAYDVFGNVATQELNNGMAGNTLEQFSYDNLHRLTESERTGATSKTVTYGYDAAGNFNFKSDFSLDTGTPYNLATGGLGGGGANAVKSVELKGGGTRRYGYDASGNMTSDDAIPSQQFSAVYDHANLATKLQRGAVINYFTYGPNNAKARQTGTDGSKVYLGGYEDWITANQTKVSLGNYAQITNGTGGRVLHYFLTDRLGSVDAVTDGNGNLIETRGYDAFGAPRTGVWGDATQIASTAITPKGFTSHEHLNSVQLIHMNGRMYDYQLGRFLGVDPFIQAPTNSQSMNPYSYIMNNPLSGTDPTGYSVTCTAGDPDCVGDIDGVAGMDAIGNCNTCFGGGGTSDKVKDSSSTASWTVSGGRTGGESGSYSTNGYSANGAEPPTEKGVGSVNDEASEILNDGNRQRAQFGRTVAKDILATGGVILETMVPSNGTEAAIAIALPFASKPVVKLIDAVVPDGVKRKIFAQTDQMADSAQVSLRQAEADLKPNFIVSQNETVMPTNKDFNLVDSNKKNGDWFQIHNTHTDAKAPGNPHTHYPEQHDLNRTREIRNTTGADLDKADDLLKTGQMRERINRGDRGGPIE